MDTSERQQLLQLLLGGGSTGSGQDSGSGAIGSQLTSGIIDQLQPQLQLFFVISTIITVLILVIFIVNLVYRLRVERAILRIDKNLQKLVGDQEVAAATDNIEQK